MAKLDKSIEEPVDQAGEGQWRAVLIFAFSALGYFASASLGYALRMQPSGAVTLWPPAGVMLALLLLAARRDWPAILLGGFAGSLGASLTAGVPWGLSVGVAVLTGKAALAAWVVNRLVGTRVRLASLREVLGFTFGAVVLSNALVSFAGAFLAVQNSHVPYDQAWFIWWVGDGLGMLIIVPVALTWVDSAKQWAAPKFGRILEAGLLFTALLAIADFTLGQERGLPIEPRPYMAYPFLFWAALRFGPVGAATAALVLTAVTCWNVTIGVGPFAGAGQTIVRQTLQMFVYLVVVSVSSLVPAAIMSESKEAERRLAESERRFRLMAESLDEGIFLTKREDVGKSEAVYANPACERIFGQPLAVFGSTAAARLERVHPEDHELARSAAGTGPGFRDLEFRLVWRDGSVRWISASGFPVHDESGKVLYFVRVVRDITERKLAEERVKASEHRLRNVIDGLGPSLFVGLLTTDGIVLEANRPALEAANLKPEDVLGKPVEETYWFSYSETVKQQLRAAIERAAQGEASRFDVVVRAGEGQWLTLDFSLNPLRDETGAVKYLVPSGAEITERKRAEEAARQSHEFLQLALRVGRIGWWVSNPSTDENYVSPEAKGIFGMPEDAKAPTFPEWMESVHPSDRDSFRTRLAQAIQGVGAVTDLSVRILHPDGSYRWLSTRGTAIKDSMGAIRLLGVSMDVTESKLAEETLRRSQERYRELAAHLQTVREEEKTEIAREIHDDLGQSLTALKMDLYQLRRDTALPKINSMIDLVDSTVGSVRRIASELRPGVLDDLGLAAAIEWQGQEFQARTGIECRMTLAEQIPSSRERDTALFRIFQESLTNVVRHAQATRVDVRLLEEADAITLEIHDNGVGIPPEPKRRKRSLGLLGMRERAAIVGGTVEVSGGPGQGTTVRVRLPLTGGGAP